MEIGMTQFRAGPSLYVWSFPPLSLERTYESYVLFSRGDGVVCGVWESWKTLPRKRIKTTSPSEPVSSDGGVGRSD